MNIESVLQEAIDQVLSKYPHVFLVEMNHNKDNYEIVLDGDKLLGIYDISEISRELNYLADERMPETSYSLDVGTPGADSDIKMLRQYPKHIGRNFELLLEDGRELNGKLTKVDSNILSFECKTGEKQGKKAKTENIETEFDNIKKANIILSFK